MSGRILVGVDGSEGSLRALTWALEEATIRASALEAVIVWQSPEDFPRDFSFPADEGALAERARARLAKAVAATAGVHTSVAVEPIVLEGDPAERLCERAAPTDLLVVGSRGHGTFTRLLLGSVSSKCARHRRSPIAIVPAPHGDGRAQVLERTGRIAVGVDGSAGSLRALRWAIDEAEAREAAVQAVMIWRGIEPDDDMAWELATFPSVGWHDLAGAEHARAHLDQVVAKVEGGPGVEVERVVLEGDAAEILCRRAAGTDLLVVGSRGRGTFVDVALGSVSAKCAHHSPRPVVIVPTARDAPVAGPVPRT